MGGECCKFTAVSLSLFPPCTFPLASVSYSMGLQSTRLQSLQGLPAPALALCAGLSDLSQRLLTTETLPATPTKHIQKELEELQERAVIGIRRIMRKREGLSFRNILMY